MLIDQVLNVQPVWWVSRRRNPPTFVAAREEVGYASLTRLNAVEALKPREKTKFTEKSIAARAGNGGAVLSFTVGDGNLKISNR